VQRPEAAGEDHEALGVLHEHRLADEEVPEVERDVDEVVALLLERELDVAADGERPRETRPPVRGLHDAGTAPGDDREARLPEEPRGLHADLVLDIAGPDARGAEDRYRVPDLPE